MAKLPEEKTWEAGIYQIEQTDPVVGGPPDLAKGQGITNVPARQLANRTAWLKGQIEALQQALANIDVSADIQTAIDALIDDAPTALNTLKELAAAIGNDAHFAATMARQMVTKLTKDADASVKSLTSAGGIAGTSVDLTVKVEIRAPKGHAAFIDLTSDGRTGDYDWRVYNALDKTLHLAADSGHAVVIFHQDGSISTKKYGALENHFAARASLDALTSGAPTALNTLKELAAAINNDPKFAATMARQLGTKLTKDAEASVARLVSAGGLYVNGGHVGDGDNDYGLIISAFEPAISLLDRSDKGGSVQIRAQSDGSIWLLRDTLNDGTIGHDSSKTTKIVVKFSPNGPIFYNANGDPIAHFKPDGQIWTKLYGALEDHFAAKASLDALTSGAPAALNTLKELAAAINNDPNFAATMARQMATKLTKDAEASVARLVSAGTISGKRAVLTDSVEIRAPKGRDAYIDLTSDGHTGDFDWRVIDKIADKALHFCDASGHAAVAFHQDGSISSKKYGPDLGFTGNLSESGYQKLPSGLIIQWGKTSDVESSTYVNASFPIVFPNACLQATVGNVGGGATMFSELWFNKSEISGRMFSGFSLAQRAVGHMTYLAVGH